MTMFETPEEHRKAFVDLAFPNSLRKLRGQGLYRLIGPDKDDPLKHREQINRPGVEWLGRENVPEHLHAFISPTLRSAFGAPGKKAGVLASGLVWVDVDGDRSLDVHAAARLASEAGVPPTAVVRSGALGNKGHLYWRLEEAFFVKDALEQFELMLKRLQTWLGGDPMVAQAAAVMRWPGSCNIKPEYGTPAPLCRFVELDPDCVYTWEALETIVPGLPTRPAFKPRKAKGKTRRSAAPSDLSASELDRRLRACDFVAHCVDQASVMGEGLWIDLLWNLKDFGPAGEELALDYSRPHPGFTESETLKRVRYARAQGYTARCRKIVEDGFACPRFDAEAGRCGVFPASAPADLAAQRELTVWVQGRETYRRGGNGDECIAQFVVRFDEERRAPEGVTLFGRVLTSDGQMRRLRLPAESLGDTRALKRAIAGLLASNFVCERRYLEQAANAWLVDSKPDLVTVEVSHDFGFSSDGSRFVDTHESLPSSAEAFEVPVGTPASRLGLAKMRGNKEVARLATRLLADWPSMNGHGAAEFLLGCVGWAVVAPVMETHAGVPPLLAWLMGASGRGKSTQALIAQAFFGDFRGEEDLVPFGSTALGIEDQGFFFRGALMVVDDVKQSTLERGGSAAFTTFIQRAYGRGVRLKMNRQGAPDPGRPFRATLLLAGEDLVLRETSSLARVLTFELPPKNEDYRRLGRILDLAPRVSGLTRAFVRWLQNQEGWDVRLFTRLEVHYERLRSAVEGGPNGIRIAKSAAAVLSGLELWLGWLDHVRVPHSLSVDHLAHSILGHALDQMAAVDEATPGEQFLNLLRIGLESRRLRVEPDGQHGELVGRAVLDSDGEELVCIVYRAALQQLRTLLEDGESLPPLTSIRKSLEAAGALGGCNPGRGSRAVRVGGQKCATWPIRRSFVFPDEAQ